MAAEPITEVNAAGEIVNGNGTAPDTTQEIPLSDDMPQDDDDLAEDDVAEDDVDDGGDDDLATG